ncbi:MAG: hypothetical protein WCD89_12420 [Anaerocolumna sp.]
MNDLKKIIGIVFTLVLVISLIPMNVFAAKEAEVSKSIISEDNLINQKAKLISEDGTEYLVNLYSKTEKIGTAKINSNSQDDGIYVKEIAFKIDYDHMKKVETNDITMPTIGVNSRSLYFNTINKKSFTPDEFSKLGYYDSGDWDSTGSAEGNVRINYKQNGDKYLITSVTGTWLIHQSGTYIKDKTVQIVCNQGFDTSQYISKSISSASFDIATGFTKYADSTQGIVGIGAKSTCTLYRTSGSSWTFVVPNMIAGSIPSL